MRLFEKLGRIRQTPENMAVLIIGAITMLVVVNKVGYLFGWLLRKVTME